MSKRDITLGVIGVLLAGTTVTGLIGWSMSSRRVAELESQIEVLLKKEKQSAVDRSISAQMEEIANQQKEISDEKREEALQQTRVANELRRRSDIERQNALEAERNALASEKKALEASAIAENERQIAEHQRVQAELAKRTTDTLSYISLGRSLGSLSVNQYRVGNHDLAALLCYASYLYTNRYHGDLFYPTVFLALSLSSQSTNEWRRHSGALMDMDFSSTKKDQLVTVSNYGEIMLHVKDGEHLKTTMLFNDKNYDFRDVYIHPTTGNIYAISRTGHLFVKREKQQTIIPLEKIVHPMSISEIEEKYLLIIGEHDIALFDISSNSVVNTRHLDCRITCVSRTEYRPLLFDNNGYMYKINTIDDIQKKKIPVPGVVTAYADSKNTKYQAYGMSDGTIFLRDNKGKNTRLVGHRSRISRVRINGYRLFSASYDGTVNLWITDSEKPEPMTLFTDRNWLMNFTFDKSKNHLWVGDQNGKLAVALISVSQLADNVKKKLKRNFTREEWNYYIGKKVPYEKFIN